MANYFDQFDAPAAPNYFDKFDAPDNKSRSWADVPIDALFNAPRSAKNFLGSVAQTVLHPVDTASTLFDAAAGGLKNALPASVSGFIDSIDHNPAAGQRAEKTADAVGAALKNRYGSVESLKNTIATDPVGAVADLSTVLGGAGALFSKAAGAVAPMVTSQGSTLAKTAGFLGDASKTLGTASSMTNPLSSVAPIARGIGSLVEVPKQLLGLSTGVGAENVAQAFKSGANGKTAFLDNLTGSVPMSDVLDAAKQNIKNMGAEKSAAYRSGMVNIKADKSILDFVGIDKALQDAAGAVMYKGQVKNATGAKALQAMQDAVDTWKASNPSDFHTPEGLDALKQKIGGIVEAIPFEEKTARLAGNGVYNAIKTEINTQAPTYANVMKDYSEASDLIKEIERALSLGQKASVDTGLRKLQSLSRNNASTNYGSRLDLAKTLEQAGGNELMPSIAGQAMSSWTPRGLAGNAGGLATLGASIFHNPMALGLLPFQSPKAVGATLYGAGKAYGTVANPIGNALTNALGIYNPERLKGLGLMAYQLGNAPN